MTAGGSLVGEVTAQLGHLRRADRRTEPCRQRRFEQAAHLENLARLLDARLGDARAAGVFERNELVAAMFAGRAAFLLIGAMVATAMSANVFFWIIPGQRKLTAQLKGGEPVDPVHGQRAKQRSLHNTYFTLPVLAAMLSNHYGFLYGAKANWLVLVLLMLTGALIPHSFVARHKALVQNRRVPWEYAALGSPALVGLAFRLAPAAGPAVARPAAAGFAEVQAVVDRHCAMRHNARLASKNVRFDSADEIGQHAQQIHQQAVVLNTMTLNNATQMTDAERALLGRWFEAGASMK